MISFSIIDLVIIFSFFVLLMVIGFIPKKEEEGNSESFLLSNRKVGLLLFIMTNVATWYGGILGVGEFTYRYGLLSWFTQGLPYYIFAIIFAFLFAKKIRTASLFTIPDKLEETYGRKVGLVSAVIVFILVSPAPYILMIGNLISVMFNINLFYGLVIGTLLSGVYLLKGGYKSDLYTDVFQFFLMFIGFIVALVVAYNSFGGYTFLQNNLPKEHLSLTGNVSIVYVIVWFLIALWTFADPGFHQRCYAARTGNIAKWGIVISVVLWAVFDFLTTSTGLYARAILPGLKNPVLSFPLFAERTLGVGVKGIFYVAMFATIMSTSNSFLFLSATTFGRDFVYKLSNEKNEKRINHYTRIGLIISAILAIALAYFIQSVVSIWYLIGSICIPSIIILISGAYFNKLRVSRRIALLEIVFSITGSIIWLTVKPAFSNSFLNEIEPMIVGMLISAVIHLIGMRKRFKKETA